MGGEIGQWHEWNCKEEISWDLLQVPYHQQLHRCMKELYALYSSQDPLWYYDNSDANSNRGFAWLLCAPPLVSYFRRGSRENLLCIHNFYEGKIKNAQLPIDSNHSWKVLFSTDCKEYGGLGEMDDPIICKGKSLCLTLPPLTTLILSREG